MTSCSKAPGTDLAPVCILHDCKLSRHPGVRTDQFFLHRVEGVLRPSDERFSSCSPKRSERMLSAHLEAHVGDDVADQPSGGLGQWQAI